MALTEHSETAVYVWKLTNGPVQDVEDVYSTESRLSIPAQLR